MSEGFSVKWPSKLPRVGVALRSATPLPDEVCGPESRFSFKQNRVRVFGHSYHLLGLGHRGLLCGKPLITETVVLLLFFHCSFIFICVFLPAKFPPVYVSSYSYPLLYVTIFLSLSSSSSCSSTSFLLKFFLSFPSYSSICLTTVFFIYSDFLCFFFRPILWSFKYSFILTFFCIFFSINHIALF